MADSDLIDFNVIEDHKENIQALPSGRSAKALAALYSPPLSSNNNNNTTTTQSSHAQDQHSEERAQFEEELVLIDEADDPLDIYDRYVKWTLDTYPSAQSTPQSQLLPLLERATKAFLPSPNYKNDPRYLKLWLHYIRFFSDTPQETFIFLSRQSIGESLALFYEEYAAWLESSGRWAQAEEVYKAGIEREAHPAARLVRKFGEFERRMQARPREEHGPESPALPVTRPALAAKSDPFSAASAAESRQAARAGPAAAAAAATKKPKSGKMAIFADESPAESPSALGTKDGKSWDSIGSLAQRKKENAAEAKPWAGETLKTGKTNTGMQKMAIFRSSSQSTTLRAYETSKHESQRTVHPRTGKTECIFVNLEAVYPDPGNAEVEYCFEELMAMKRGLLDVDWSKQPRAIPIRQTKQQTRPDVRTALAQPSTAQEPAKPEKPKGFGIFQDAPAAAAPPPNEQSSPKPRKQRGFAIFSDDSAPEESKTSEERPPSMTIDSSLKVAPLNDENDENHPPRPRDVDIAKRLRREERANRTRKIKVMEVEHVQKETQTVKLNMSSPTGPKIRKKKAVAVAEPTMTINTREAMDEIYGIFSQPGATAEESNGDEENSDSEDDDDDDDDDSDDDYSTAGESTTTGHVSASASDYGDETKREILASQEKQGHSQEADGDDDGDDHDDDGDKTNVSAWSDYTGNDKAAAAAASEVDTERGTSATDRASASEDASEDESEADQLTSRASAATPFEDEDEEEEPKTRYIPLPPEDYEPMRSQYRDPALVANSRLPFMTPIVEQTESSIGVATARGQKDYFAVKTPSRQTYQEVEPIDTIDEDGPWSSPFQDILSGAAEDKRKILQPIRTKTTKGMVSLSESKPKPLGRSLAQEPFPLVNKGPIITDLQVNPVDPELRKTILSQIEPPLSSYEGYFEHLDQDSGRVPEIRRYAKAVGKKGGAVDRSALPNQPVLSFAGTDSTYTLKRELGAGAFAPVYLVENSNPSPDTNDDNKNSGDENAPPAKTGQDALTTTRRHALEALKMEDPPSAWEFYMIRQTHLRLGRHRAAASIVHAYELHLFRDSTYLLESFRPQGTLLDIINAARATSDSPTAAMDEPLAMFFAIELLRTVEALHANGVIHGDIKADNVLVRFDQVDEDAWSASYRADGSRGWAAKGISLIDFGRGIDTRVFAPSTQFVADWPTSSADCPEMRELRPWTWQVDYHGLAGTLHSLLFGKYMSVVSAAHTATAHAHANANANTGGRAAAGLGSSNRSYRVREPLKRYWQTHIWARAFEMLLNPGRHAEGEEGAKMPLVKGLAGLRAEMETWLEANCERGVGLRGMVRRMEEMLASSSSSSGRRGGGGGGKR